MGRFHIAVHWDEADREAEIYAAFYLPLRFYLILTSLFWLAVVLILRRAMAKGWNLKTRL
jgi:hypothetical protein